MRNEDLIITNRLRRDVSVFQVFQRLSFIFSDTNMCKMYRIVVVVVLQFLIDLRYLASRYQTDVQLYVI